MTLRKLLAPCAMLLLCASAHAEESLFFRMGGEAKLKPAVDELVESCSRTSASTSCSRRPT